MDRAKISVVVPVYNIEDFIEKTIQSICSQTYKNLEIIIVDDGSSDNSGKIVDFLAEKDDRIRVIHKENAGVTAARIDGIRISTGDWIGFVDGDDYIESDMYEMLMNNAEKYGADISHCGYQMVFPSRVDYYYNTKKLVVQDTGQGISDLLEGGFVEPGLWNKLVKADIVKSVVNSSEIDVSIKINEDLLMNYYFFKMSKKSVYYDICSYHYMLRKGSAATSGISPNKLFDPIRVLKLIYNDTKNVNYKRIVTGRLASLYINGASMINTLKESYVDEYIKMCYSELKSVKSEIVNGPYGKSIKFRCRLCVLSPALYRLFHKLYAKARGTDNKYEVR